MNFSSGPIFNQLRRPRPQYSRGIVRWCKKLRSSSFLVEILDEGLGKKARHQISLLILGEFN